MMIHLISVIVPIYKVEPYLHRCIDSILSQTYSNLEIILVDDGSPDRCGEICDEYAKHHQNIKVVHKKNGGLSSARNAGTAIATGEYLAYVDSDDCIHPEMYEQLYNCIQKYNTRLAFCQPNMCYNQEITKITYNEPIKKQTKEEVIKTCMLKQQWWAAWTKLYHKSLIPYLHFPEGRTNEDYAIMMYLYDQCDEIVVNYNRLYNYCIRENSICTSSLNPKKFDQILNAKEVYNYMRDKHPNWSNEAFFVWAQAELGLLSQIYESKNKQFIKQEKEIYAFIKNNIVKIIYNPFILMKQKILFSAAFISPYFFTTLLKIINLKQK